MTNLLVKKLKLNTDLLEHKSGDIIEIKIDKDGVPLDRFWRNRVRDSKIDNCVQWQEKGKKK